MQIMIHQNQLQEVVVVLESFVMTWGLRKSQGADELAKYTNTFICTYIDSTNYNAYMYTYMHELVRGFTIV